MPVVSLTPSFISALAVSPGKARTEYCDRECPGLYVEARATSSRGTWYVRYKDAAGVTRHAKIGTTDGVSLNEARKSARALKAEIAKGANPSEERKQQRAVPTLRDFVEEQFLPYIKARKRSWRGDKNRLYQRLLPAFGSLPLNRISRKQLVDFHLALRAEGLAPATANHFIKLMRYLLNTAVSWELIQENPAAKIPLFTESNLVENYLTEDQLKKLLFVLQTHPQRLACRVAMLLLSTGARLNEGLQATWDQFDLQTRVWRIPATNSKSKKVRSVPLNDTALAVLEELGQVAKTGPLFVNPRTRQPLKTLHKAFGKIRKAAEIPHFRIHDLRHQFASFLVNSGRTLYEVGQALGHANVQVTARYAHLSQKTLQAASDTASHHIQAAMPRRRPTPPDAMSPASTA